MTLDIEPDDLETIRAILRQQLPEQSTVYVFGSRAKGTAKEYSDLDLAIDLPHRISTFALLAELAYAFEVSDLPYKVDIVDLNAVDANFCKMIEKDCVTFEFQ